MVPSTWPYTAYHPSAPAFTGEVPHSTAVNAAKSGRDVTRMATRASSPALTACVSSVTHPHGAASRPKRRQQT